jgi:hypothetical protein
MRTIELNIHRMLKNKHFDQDDLKNVLRHSFDQHSECLPMFCHKAPVELDDDCMTALQSKVDFLVSRCEMIANNYDNNLTESFMNMVSMFLSNRRVNLHGGGGFTRRTEMAGLNSCKGRV